MSLLPYFLSLLFGMYTCDLFYFCQELVINNIECEHVMNPGDTAENIQ